MRDSSVVARKLETYFDGEAEAKKRPAKRPSFLLSLTIVVLMTVAVGLTKMTLGITRLINRLESKN